MFLKRLSIACLAIAAMLTSAMSLAASNPLDEGLQKAAARGDVEAVKDLIRRGANIDARNRAGETPLLVATHHDHVEAARTLIEAGADVNVQDVIQDSPYLYAGARGHSRSCA